MLTTGRSFFQILIGVALLLGGSLGCSEPAPFTQPVQDNTPSKPPVEPKSSLRQLTFTLSSPLSRVLPGDVGDTLAEEIFQAMENHATSREGFSLPPAFSYSTDSNGPNLYEAREQIEKCNDESLNSVYESLLAKNIMTSAPLNQMISPIFHKLFAGMKNQSIGPKGENWYDSALNGWVSNTDHSKVLPVTQKQKFHSLKTELEAGGNPALELDFILFNAKKLDGIGLDRKIRVLRNTFYNDNILPNRGKRTDASNEVLRTQYGIAKFDVSSLSMPNAQAWRHWGRDICQIDESSCLFNQNSAKLKLPFGCGLSGTTNLAFWTLFSSKAKLSRMELRYFVLSLWATLCADGGHSLQEILSTAVIASNYVWAESKKDPSFALNFEMETIRNLHAITKEMSALGSGTDISKFGIHYKGFFSKITAPGFWDARAKSQVEFLEYFHREAHCKHPTK